jgi:hypothetical protein
MKILEHRIAEAPQDHPVARQEVEISISAAKPNRTCSSSQFGWAITCPVGGPGPARVHAQKDSWRADSLPDCTDAVPMGVFRVHFGNLGLFRIWKLHIPQGFRESWFESMPGSQPLFSTTYRIFQAIFVPILYESLIWLKVNSFSCS